VQAQKEFVVEYKALRKQQSADAPCYFMDATHPIHNPIANYGWIKRGQNYAVKTNTGRRRLNINGAMNISTLEPRYDDTINATIALFKQAKHPDAKNIPVIADNARYYRAKIVTEYLQTSRIQLIFLPPYAPNLNLIERYWKFFKKKVLYGTYYETFDRFKLACDEFFNQACDHVESLRSLLAENFQLIAIPKTDF
jgi:transposase